MYLNKKLKKQILDTWKPKIEARIEANHPALVGRIPSVRLDAMAIMANTRMVYEKKKRGKIFEAAQGVADLTNTVGRSAFAFGNNPQNGYSDFYSTLGSGEVIVNNFGIFIEAAAATFAMDLLPIVPMMKSSLGIYIAEPVYAGGNLDEASSKPEVIHVVLTTTGAGGPALVVGTDYTIATADTGGEDVAVVTYIGRHRVNGNPVFRIKTVNDNTGGGGTDWTASLVADLFDTGTNGSGIYTDASNFWGFDPATVDLLEGFTNYLAGYSGAGTDDTDAWFIGRGDGAKYSKPMSRYKGSKSYYRSMGVRQWNRNVSAETVQVDVELQTEQVQDMIMDHDMDANEFAESIIADQLSQHMNDHILGRFMALGWSHHKEMNLANGFNMNVFLADSGSTGTAQTFLGKEDTSLTISGIAGVLPSTAAISENLTTLQRRVITRLLYGSGIIGTRARRGRGDQIVTNVTYGTSIRDVRGFKVAEFENSIDSTTGLSYLGDLYGMKTYEDGLMDPNDLRLNVSRHGGDKDPGIKFCPYLLNEKISTIAEGTMGPKIAVKSRYALPEAGSYPELNYLTFVVESDGGYQLV